MRNEAHRYRKQARFAPLGPDGQRRLGDAHVMIVGVGALGSHSAESLLRAGVGRLTLFDRDVVVLDNLPRQTLFDERDAREERPKAVAAADRLRQIDSSARIDARAQHFDRDAFEAIERPDVIVDGTDNFDTRLLINDLAVRDGISWVYGGVVGAAGRAATIVPGETPCLRCLLPDSPPAGEGETCETAGVIEPAVAQVAAFQAAETLKLLTGAERTPGMFMLDAWEGFYGIVLRNAARRPDCESCGTRRFPSLTDAASTEAVSLCGRNAVQILPPTGGIDLPRLAARLQRGGAAVQSSPQLLRFEVDDCRFSVFADGRALILGLEDTDRARALYDRWIGR